MQGAERQGEQRGGSGGQVQVVVVPRRRIIRGRPVVEYGSMENSRVHSMDNDAAKTSHGYNAGSRSVIPAFPGHGRGRLTSHFDGTLGVRDKNSRSCPCFLDRQRQRRGALPGGGLLHVPLAVRSIASAHMTV